MVSSTGRREGGREGGRGREGERGKEGGRGREQGREGGREWEEHTNITKNTV